MSASVAVQKVEIVEKATRYRAYGPATLTRKPTGADYVRRSEKGLPTFGPNARIAYKGEQIVASGPVSGSTLVLDGKDATRVVFYGGKVEDEVVVGSAELTGPTQFELELRAEQKIEDGTVEE